MALDNLISVELTPAELTAVDGALTVLETTLMPKLINLTNAERSQYGRIANNTENWVDKCKGYMDNNAPLIPNYLSKSEFDKDYTAYKGIEPRLNRLLSIAEGLEDTQKLISSDVYGACITFYRNLKVAEKQNVPGSSVIYADLKAQFAKGPKKAATPPTP